MPLPAIPIVGGLIAWLGGAIAQKFAVETLKWLAWKALLLGLLTIVLPIVLMNVFDMILEKVMAAANAKIAEVTAQGLPAPISVQLTGLGGWFASCLKVPQCFALIMGTATYRVALRMVPFVRLG
jgi:hypothetical protein